MGKFLGYIEDIKKMQNNLVSLDKQYEKKHKGSIYQQRRSTYRKAIEQYVYKCKQLATGPVIYTYRYDVNGEPHCITLIDMTINETQAYLEIITRQTITNLNYSTLSTGIHCKL